METKFQSSFIPRGSASANPRNISSPVRRQKNFFSFIAWLIFLISFVGAAGLFGFKYYLKYRIDAMSAELDSKWASLQPEVINELTDMNTRINSTKSLIAGHKILSPLFDFLEESTPATVRFTGFSYNSIQGGIQLNMKGEAVGYQALALQADIISKNSYFQNPIFSDFELNAQGNVGFSFTSTIDPSLVSYVREIEFFNTPAPTPASSDVSTSTATSTSTSSGQATPQ